MIISSASAYKRRLPTSSPPTSRSTKCSILLYVLIFLSGLAFGVLGVYFRLDLLPSSASSLSADSSSSRPSLHWLPMSYDRSKRENEASGEYLPTKTSESHFLNSNTSYYGDRGFVIPDWAFDEKALNLNDRASKCIRLLFMTAIYTENQFLAFQRVLDGLRDISNSDMFDVSVLLQVANGFDEQHPRYSEIQQRMYCQKRARYIPIIIESYGKIGFGLNAKHRIYMRNHLNEYDLFIYAEEDMNINLSILLAYYREMDYIRQKVGSLWYRYSIGLIRFEERSEEQERVSWEYKRGQIYGVTIDKISSPDKKYIATLNPNQAIFILPREQVIDLDKRCNFLTDIGANQFYRTLRKAMDKQWKYLSVGVSEWSSTFQWILQCGVRRVIPMERIQDFMIHHSTNIAQVRRPKSELLTMTMWLDLIRELYESPSVNNTLALEDFYNKNVFEQFNMHLINPLDVEAPSKWTYGLHSGDY